MTWTRFMDMHSGGDTKEEPYEYIYIEAPENAARRIFYSRFGHSPNRVTCTCCGEDYAVSESTELWEASAFDRNCHWDDNAETYKDQPKKPGEKFNYGSRPYQLLEDYIARPDVLVIRAAEIKDSEREGDVPEQGYVWVD